MTHVDAQTQWRGRHDTARWRFLALLVLSGALHVVLTPWAGLWGLARWLPAFNLELPPEEPVNAIPVDLVAAQPAPRPAPAPPEPEPRSAAPAESTPAEPEAPKPAPAPAEPPPQPEAPEPAPADDGSIGDPVALSGTAGKIADANANVRLMLYTDRIREHSLGRRIGRLLQTTPQWRDFFGPAQVDPIRDIDRVLIAGPQLRDSSNVVAVVQHSLPDERMEQGLDALVARGGGEWMEGKVKMARTRADRAERLIVLPAPGIVAVVPPSAEKSARSLGKDTRFAAGPDGVAMQAYIVTPWRVFMGLPVQIPKSIEWVRIEVLARPDGGASARLLAQDASEEAATRNARDIERLIRAATELDLGSMGAMGALGSLLLGGSQHKMLEKVKVYAEGDQIVGSIEASMKQLGLITDLAASAADFYGRGSAAPPPAQQARSSSGSSSASGSGAAPSPAPDAVPAMPGPVAAPEPEPVTLPEPRSPADEASPRPDPDPPSASQNDDPAAGE